MGTMREHISKYALSEAKKASARRPESENTFARQGGIAYVNI